MRARAWTTSAVGVAAMILACVLAAPAIAAKPGTGTTNKPYSLVLAPATVPGGSTATITATYTNLTGQQQLGSSDLTAPEGFILVDAQVTDGSDGASATVDGNVVHVRGLSTPPGGSATVTLTVETGCGGGTGQWKAVTKQSNDFNGQPGNDLSLDTSKSSTTTTATAGCQLRFTTQPKDVQVGSTITGVAGDPNGPPVAVSVLDADGNPTHAAISITVGLGTAPVGASLSGTKTVTSTNGVATFGNLSVDAQGTYTLAATSPNATSTTSDPFRAYLSVTPCINNVFCTATASTTGTVPGSNRPYTNTFKVDASPNSDPTVTDDGGALGLEFGKPIDACPSYNPVSPDMETLVGPNRVKTVTSTIAKALMDAAHRSASSLKSCLIAPYSFNLGLASANGGSAPPIGDVDGDGNTDFAGLLPDCGPKKDNLPCQLSATLDSKGNGVVVYVLPADPRDPSHIG